MQYVLLSHMMYGSRTEVDGEADAILGTISTRSTRDADLPGRMVDSPSGPQGGGVGLPRPLTPRRNQDLQAIIAAVSSIMRHPAHRCTLRTASQAQTHYEGARRGVFNSGIFPMSAGAAASG